MFCSVVQTRPELIIFLPQPPKQLGKQACDTTFSWENHLNVVTTSARLCGVRVSGRLTCHSQMAAVGSHSSPSTVHPGVGSTRPGVRLYPLSPEKQVLNLNFVLRLVLSSH